MNLDSIINQYNFNLVYAKALVEDLNQDQMTEIPHSGLENHPAWTLGHLVTASALLAEDIGADFQIPSGWSDLFLRKGPGDPRLPETDKSKYPSKFELISELEVQHNKVIELLSKLDEEDLNNEFKWRFSSYMPKLRDLILFFCISHENMHLSQLAAWRRAMGLDSALAKL